MRRTRHTEYDAVHERIPKVKYLRNKLNQLVAKGEEGQTYAYGGGGLVLVVVIVLLILFLR